MWNCWIISAPVEVQFELRVQYRGDLGTALSVTVPVMRQTGTAMAGPGICEGGGGGGSDGVQLSLLLVCVEFCASYCWPAFACSVAAGEVAWRSVREGRQAVWRSWRGWQAAAAGGGGGGQRQQ